MEGLGNDSVLLLWCMWRECINQIFNEEVLPDQKLNLIISLEELENITLMDFLDRLNNG